MNGQGKRVSTFFPNIQKPIHVEFERKRHTYAPSAPATLVDSDWIIDSCIEEYRNSCTDLQSVFNHRCETTGKDMKTRSIVAIKNGRSFRAYKKNNKPLIFYGSIDNASTFLVPLSFWPFLQIISDIHAFTKARVNVHLKSRGLPVETVERCASDMAAR